MVLSDRLRDAVHTTSTLESSVLFDANAAMKTYDQFVLFGDSITEQAASQSIGFAFAPALQDGMPHSTSTDSIVAFICIS